MILRPVLSSVCVPCNDQGGTVCSWLPGRRRLFVQTLLKVFWRQQDYSTAPSRVKCCKADEKKQPGKRQELDVMYLSLLQPFLQPSPPFFTPGQLLLMASISGFLLKPRLIGICEIQHPQFRSVTTNGRCALLCSGQVISRVHRSKMV